MGRFLLGVLCPILPRVSSHNFEDFRVEPEQLIDAGESVVAVGRFQGRANLNRFSKGRQLSFLAMGNNVNEQGFSMDDYMNFTGGAQQMMAGGGRVRHPSNGSERPNSRMTTESISAVEKRRQLTGPLCRRQPRNRFRKAK